jgi:peptide/nickel transport system permease protein
MSRQADWADNFRRVGRLDGIGIAGVMAVTIVAVLATWLTPYDPEMRVAAATLPPSPLHWFGTDEIGRDLFSRALLGVQLTWLPALGIIAFSAVVGTIVGVISGTVGGWVDLVLQRLVELFLVLPSALVALAVVAALGPGLANIMLALAVFWWPWYARISRDEIKRIAARPHVEAARLAGISPMRLVLRHMLPGALPALVVAATLDVANVILAVALMSFLGLGQPAPAPELGAMTSRTLDSLTVAWWLPIFPALVIMLVCLLANLAGDGLRRAFRGT